MLILVVEDDPTFRDVLSAMLEENGEQVLTAADVLSAVALLATLPAAPDLILLDLQMPQLNGGDLHTALARDPAFARVPIVVLTGLDAQSARALVPDGTPILYKPVALDELLLAIAQVGESREAGA
ncbi:MAG TPA: response regulator [Roseiflexaceae bacterium]|nr:response regulator [Roseiflexaceae bacterium]